MPKLVQNKATAYMLVYVKKELYPAFFKDDEEDFP